MQSFHIGAILSVTAGILLRPFDEVHHFLEYMAGEPVWTHQLPRIADEASPTILRQHPQLAEVSVEGVTGENAVAFLAQQVERFGEKLEVAPLTLDDHERIDPLSELAEKIHPDRIITV